MNCQKNHFQNMVEPPARLARKCKEFGEFQVATLSLLLWENVTLDPEFIILLMAALCDRLAKSYEQGHPFGVLHPDSVVFSISNGEITHVRLERPRLLFGGQDEERECDVAFARRIYQSIEQQKGKFPSVESDIYAIGQMLNVALTGVPARGRLRQTSRQRCLKLTRGERQSERLKEVIASCLAPQKRRYKKLLHLRRDLLRIRQDLPPLGPNSKPSHEFTGFQQMALVLTLFGILLISSWGHNTQGQSTPISADAIWSKPAQEYSFGDPFAITIVPGEKCFCYLFYVSKNQSSVSLYPSKNQGFNTISPSSPLNIAHLGHYMLTVDDDPSGKLVTLLIRDGARGRAINQTILKESEWDQSAEPKNHWLRLSEQELLIRLSGIKQAYPEDVYVSIENAPLANKTRIELRRTYSKEADRY